MTIPCTVDSPLNEEGLAQARELNDLIENYRGEHLGDVQAMRDPSKSVVCSFQPSGGRRRLFYWA